MKKNILVFVLVMALVMGLAACASGNVANTDNNNANTNTGDTNTDNNTNDNTQNDATTGTENDDTTTGDDAAAGDEGTTDEPSTDDTTTDEPAGDEPSTDAPAASGDADSMTLPEIMAAIMDIETELPMLGEIAPDAETFEFYTFVPAQDGLEAYVSEPMISSIAHSVVLVRVSGDLDVEEIAKQIEDNHDPRKWMCVEAEKSIVTVNGSTILLVMSTTEVADAVTANFNALWA